MGLYRWLSWFSWFGWVRTSDIVIDRQLLRKCCLFSEMPGSMWRTKVPKKCFCGDLLLQIRAAQVCKTSWEIQHGRDNWWIAQPPSLVAGLNSQIKNRNGNDIATSKIETNRSIDLSIPSIPCIMSVPSGPSTLRYSKVFCWKIPALNGYFKLWKSLSYILYTFIELIEFQENHVCFKGYDDV